MSDKKYWPCDHIGQTGARDFYLKVTDRTVMINKNFIESWDSCPFKGCGAKRPKPRLETLNEAINRLANNAECERAMTRDAVDTLYLKIISGVDDMRYEIKTLNNCLSMIREKTVVPCDEYTRTNMALAVNSIQILIDDHDKNIESRGHG